MSQRLNCNIVNIIATSAHWQTEWRGDVWCAVQRLSAIGALSHCNGKTACARRHVQCELKFTAS